ncbi:MAG: hypothetical protein V4598_06135 [Bdellovibrionota bacterium]
MLIIAGDRIVDNKGSHSETEKILSLAHKKGLKIAKLEIVDLATRWENNLEPWEFKSGASVMDAIEKARDLLKLKLADVVVIGGTDLLKTGYAPGAREKYMKLYQNKHTPLEGYNKLVPLFLKSHKLSEKNYFIIRDALFKNYARTFKGKLPDERWFKPLTKYFRGVDCANPNVDYSAQIVLTLKESADTLKVPANKRMEIIGNAFTKLTVDGYESLPKIAPYLHLKRTIDKALKEAKIDFKTEFLKGRALMDAYTCYPVVPMGLILRLGLVKKLEEIPELLKKREVTVTGGLNLGKAAWNLTSLNAMIVMREKLLSSKKARVGLVHGNGSLGNQQGITILKR